MKKINAWKTEDGKHFINKTDAQDHENFLHLKDFLKDKFFSQMNVADAIDIIWENRKQIKEKL